MENEEWSNEKVEYCSGFRVQTVEGKGFEGGMWMLLYIAIVDGRIMCKLQIMKV